MKHDRIESELMTSETKTNINKKTIAAAGPDRVKHSPMLKLVLEMGPLVLFFLANSKPALFRPLFAPLLPQSMLEGEKAGIFTATLVLMISVVVALLVSWHLTKKLPVMPVVTCVAVIFFGALTFFFHDDLFIKLKPTIVNVIFGSVLLGSLAFGKLLLPLVLDSVMNLSQEGWRQLTIRWGVFFFVLAALNEIVWRTQTTDFWVSFKAFGIMPLTIIFALAQVPVIMKHEIKEEE